MRKVAAIIFAALLTCAACIREDRSLCPCYLHVDLSRLESTSTRSVDILLVSEAGAQWHPVPESSIGDTLIMAVDKGEFEFCAWGNLGGAVIDGGKEIIYPDIPCDSLWNCVRHISTRCEDAFVAVSAQRQYRPVTIVVRGMLSGISGLKCVLTGVSGGLAFTGGGRGEIGRLVPELVKEQAEAQGDVGPYVYRTMLLTQPAADELQLKLFFMRNGEVRESGYPLGKMLLSQGEDISEGGGNPIVVDITVGSASILFTLKCNGWTTHGIYEITY